MPRARPSRATSCRAITVDASSPRPERSSGSCRAPRSSTRPPGTLASDVFTFPELEPVAAAVRAAPLEHEPPAILERRSMEHAGVVVPGPTRWQRTSAYLAPALAACLLIVAFLAFSSDDEVPGEVGSAPGAGLSSSGATNITFTETSARLHLAGGRRHHYGEIRWNPRAHRDLRGLPRGGRRRELPSRPRRRRRRARNRRRLPGVRGQHRVLDGHLPAARWPGELRLPRDVDRRARRTRGRTAHPRGPHPRLTRRVTQRRQIARPFGKSTKRRP